MSYRLAEWCNARLSVPQINGCRLLHTKLGLAYEETGPSVQMKNSRSEIVLQHFLKGFFGNRPMDNSFDGLHKGRKLHVPYSNLVRCSK